MKASCASLSSAIAQIVVAACCVTCIAFGQQSEPALSRTNPDASGATPGACQKDVTRWFGSAYEAASDSAGRKLIKAIDFSELTKRQNQQLRQCVLKLDADALSGEELLNIARMYAQAGEHERALSSATRYLQSATLTDSARASALVSMAAQYRGIKFELLQRAEPYVELLDALAPSVNLQKIAAHEGLFRGYQFLEDDELVQRHTRAIVRLAKGVKAFVRTKDAPEIPAGQIDASMLLSVYMYAAMIDGNFGHEDAGVKLLQDARQDHQEIDAKYFDGMHNPVIERLRLVGQRARTVTSQHWFNAPTGTRTIEVTGSVTLIGFTAHWCPPCQGTYAPLQAMYDSMSSRGLRVMFATEFYGYVGDQRGLNEAQEIDATRRYYESRHITFPVGMLGAAHDTASTTPRALSPEFAFYKIQQIPQTVMIDRRGNIRRIVMGWDPANNKRIPALLDTLLREK